MTSKWVRELYVLVLRSVFKNHYIAVISTKKSPWDALSSNRTRKNTILEIQTGEKTQTNLATHSVWPNLSPWVSLLTLVGSVQVWGEVVDEIAIGALRRGRKHRLYGQKYKL